MGDVNENSSSPTENSFKVCRVCLKAFNEAEYKKLFGETRENGAMFEIVGGIDVSKKSIFFVK